MRDVKYSLEWLLKTKADLMKMLDGSRRTLEQAKEDTEIWEMMVDDVDAEIAEIQAKERLLKKASGTARIWIILITFLIFLTILVSSCNLVAGAGRDITWMGEAGKEMLEHGHESVNR